MANERITENIVRDKLRSLGYYDNDNVIIEEQKSNNKRIQKLLQNASKSGNGVGKPEFIISFKDNSDFIIVIECKADISKHESKTQDNYKDYAVDGVLLYSSYLSKEFDVVSIAISGENDDEIKTNGFLQLKNTFKSKPFLNSILSPENIFHNYLYNEETKHQRYESLLDYNKELNEKLHSYKIPEANRSLLLSGILISLTHKVFKDSYSKYETAKQLANALVQSVIEQLQKSDIQNIKVDTMKHAYSFIKTNSTLSNNKELFVELIKEIDERINSFLKTYRFFDIFGDFYIEFLRYANSDKGLGIVLTPKHITELFCDVAGLNENSIVFDNCCGTGGFLITAMRKMLELVEHDNEKERNIKEKQIIGIEYQDTIFPLVCSNMIVNGDGKTNLYNTDCFNKEYKTGKKINVNKNQRVIEVTEKLPIVKYIKETFNPDIGLLNPPYKTKKSDKEELEFVLNNLNGLSKNGICVCIIPTSCVLAQRGKAFTLKEKLLNKHTLEGVFSLPNELFHNSNVTVVTSAVVIKAHQPHPKGYKTYLGYWKDDGFLKRKNKGRINLGDWENIRKIWVESFKNRQEVKNLSVMRELTPKDVWVAEAFLETDYSKLKDENFIKNMLNYSSYMFKNRFIKNASNKPKIKTNINLYEREWKYFEYDGDNGIFKIKRGESGYIIYMGEGNIPYISASKVPNGVTSLVEISNRNGNEITLSYDGSIGEAFYQPEPYFASEKIVSITLKNHKLNQYIAFFLITLLRLEKFRYNYGLKWSVNSRMKTSKIKLPIDKNGEPDWQFMEDYIKSLPYSSNL